MTLKFYYSPLGSMFKLPREIGHLVYGMTPQPTHYETKFAFPGMDRVPISKICPCLSPAPGWASELLFREENEHTGRGATKPKRLSRAPIVTVVVLD